MDISLVVVLIIIFVILGVSYYFKLKNERIEKEIRDENDRRFYSNLENLAHKYLKIGIPIITSNVKLKNDEQLYIKLDNVSWMEYRKIRTGQYTAHGFTARIKIAKGLSYRFGTGQISQEILDQLKPIDTGDLYITNMKLIFRGQFGNKSLPFNKVMKINPSILGLKVERDNGKDIYFPFNFRNYPESLISIALLWEAYETFGDSTKVINLESKNSSPIEIESSSARNRSKIQKIELVGVWFRDRGRREAFAEVNQGDLVKLMFDHGNQHDNNAIGAYTVSGKLLGFIPRNNYQIVGALRKEEVKIAKVTYKRDGKTDRDKSLQIEVSLE